MKLISCMQIDLKLSYKLIPLILVAMARPAKIIKNNKFPKLLQYLKKKVRNEVDFFVQMTIKVIYKLTFSFLRGVARHA